MSSLPLRKMSCIVAVLVFAMGAIGQESKPPATADAKEKTDKEAPLPGDAHVAQSMQLDGKQLNYTATIGTLPVYDKDGKKSGEVVFTSLP